MSDLFSAAAEQRLRGQAPLAARLRPVTIFRQTRTALELRSVLNGDERVVVGPPASLRDGDRVTPQPEGKAGA